jgi:hypothetical protein
MNTPTRPPRIIVYGEHKIGKSTFATSAPNPIVIRTETVSPRSAFRRSRSRRRTAT